jgi:hypothetical protein
MLVRKFNVGYLTKLYWQSFNSQSLQRLEVESLLLGMPVSLFIGFNKQRVYVLRSAHAQNKAAECLESCIWLGRRQSICLFSVIRFLEAHLIYNEGTLFYKLGCRLEFNRFGCLKLFFCEIVVRLFFFI